MTAKILSLQDDVHHLQMCPHVAGMMQSPPLRTEGPIEWRRAAPHRAPGDVGPTADARRALARFVAVPADRLPSRPAVQAALAAAWGADGLAALAAAFADPAALARGRRRLAAAIPRGPRTRWPDVTELVQRGNTLDADVHDAFFNIFRGEDHDALRHVLTIVDAALALRADLADTETTLDDAALARIGRGIEQAFVLATGVRPAPLALPPRREGLTDDPDRAARRWLRGHHIFLVITQALVVALDDLATTMRGAGDDAAARIQALATFAALIDLSSDTMSLTGDFAPPIYDGVIRVAMAPPFMPEGFSGVFSSDHRHLVRRLREERPMFEALRDGLPGAHADAVASMIRLYDNHKQVCSRFIGVDQGSLLMSAASGETAVDQLDKFKRSRLRSLGVAPPKT